MPQKIQGKHDLILAECETEKVNVDMALVEGWLGVFKEVESPVVARTQKLLEETQRLEGYIEDAKAD